MGSLFLNCHGDMVVGFIENVILIIIYDTSFVLGTSALVKFAKSIHGSGTSNTVRFSYIYDIYVINSFIQLTWGNSRILYHGVSVTGDTGNSLFRVSRVCGGGNAGVHVVYISSLPVQMLEYGDHWNSELNLL